MNLLRSLIGLTLLTGMLALPQCGLFAAEVGQPAAVQVTEASDEAVRAMSGFRKPAGFQVNLFAAEPDVANPVAFCVDDAGRVYVCETFRQGRGVEDNRSHGHWLDDDQAAQTVDDRLAYIRKHLGDKAEEYTKFDDRIRLLLDTDGDGAADEAHVFAAGFNSIVEGTGAGVLAVGKDVYFTCIPNLWRLRDDDGDRRAEVRDKLHEGFGVRFAFRGHDMHGLCLGSDGRLYFSIGDRGYNVATVDGRLKDPESGAVFRCELDGSRLEVFATGLRNPQELAFDDYGNLFTGDNNSDSGDRARWVYVVPGGDSGWRMSYQYLSDRGPFNREKLWHPYHDGQPAYIVPPIANFADGPSGLAYYPGTGLSDHFQGRFFLCDFRGGPGNSGVWTFRVEQDGAFFKMKDEEQTFWSILATDVDFGPDGGVYISDWVNGWNGLGKGRIYRFTSPEHQQAELARQTASLLARGMDKAPPAELQTLLGHADRRVRLRAQFELANRGAAGRDVFKTTAREGKTLLARLHAIWGLGQMARLDRANESPDEDGLLAVGLELITDADPEVRAQAAQLLGEAKLTAATDALIGALADDNLRVRYFAALGLGTLGAESAVAPLIAMLEQNDNRDPILRHGGIMGLTGAGRVEQLLATAQHPSAAVRLAAVVALRKRQSPQVALFLNDADEQIVLEAARAIHDAPLTEALPQLADLIGRPTQSDPLLRRVLNANYRLGGPRRAEALARFAAHESAPEAMRLEALRMLAAWAAPSAKDRVLNMWRPIPPRSADEAVGALRAALPRIFSGSPAVKNEAAKVAAQLGLREVVPELRGLLANTDESGATRADALQALLALKDEEIRALAEEYVGDDDPHVRTTARDVMAAIAPAAALPLLEQATTADSRIERQGAYATLATLAGGEADRVLVAALDALQRGAIEDDTRLDLLLAARARPHESVRTRLAEYEAGRDASDPLSPYRETMAGGDVERGRRIFFGKTEVSCARCHRADGVGGDVGPDLSKIAEQQQPRYLLEALVEPNKVVAKGFESVQVVTVDGRIVAGVLKGRTSEAIRLVDAEGRLIVIPADQIDEVVPGLSAMPDDLVKHLSLSELRDLMAFLQSRK